MIINRCLPAGQRALECVAVWEPHWTDEAGAWKRRGCVIMRLIEVSHNICTYKERKWLNKWDGKFGERKPRVAANCWQSDPSGLPNVKSDILIFSVRTQSNSVKSTLLKLSIRKKEIVKNVCMCQSLNIQVGLYKENMHWRLLALWSSWSPFPAQPAAPLSQCGCWVVCV